MHDKVRNGDEVVLAHRGLSRIPAKLKNNTSETTYGVNFRSFFLRSYNLLISEHSNNQMPPR